MLKVPDYSQSKSDGLHGHKSLVELYRALVAEPFTANRFERTRRKDVLFFLEEREKRNDNSN